MNRIVYLKDLCTYLYTLRSHQYWKYLNQYYLRKIIFYNEQSCTLKIFVYTFFRYACMIQTIICAIINVVRNFL